MSEALQCETVQPINGGGVEYRDVPGFPGYRVGNDGSIWGCRMRGKRAKKFLDKWRLFKNTLSKDGYRKVILYGDRKNIRYTTLHILVLECFLGRRPRGMVAAHNNGIRTDCRLANLRWDTPKNNCADKIKHGTAQRGERSGAAKLNDEKVLRIKRLLTSGQNQKSKIAAHFGVSRAAIRNISIGKTWTHLRPAALPENTMDAMFDGRHRAPTGDKSAVCKLKDQQISECFFRRAGGESTKSIANSFGVHPSHIRRILSGDRRQAWLRANPKEAAHFGLAIVMSETPVLPSGGAEKGGNK